MTNSREKVYPLDIVYVKVSVDRKLLDSVRKIPFKTSNNFPTITLQGNKGKNLDAEKIGFLYCTLVDSHTQNQSI